MNLPITPRQKQMLSIIYGYIKNTGYPPSFEEMKDRLDVTSNQSVFDLLTKLEEKGAIKRNESAARSIAILPYGYRVLDKPPLVPFLGISHAGAPMEAIEIPGEWQPLSQDISRLTNEVFLIKISGDSMINAGIENGDVVLVETQKEFASGDIVLAEISGEVTVKRFVSDDTPPYIYLKPENPDFPIIPFNEETHLQGKVISVLKNGQWRTIK